MSEPAAPASKGSPGRLAATGGFGLLLGVLAAVGWHVQRPSGAIFHIFGQAQRVTEEQTADWVDMWRPLWWPVALGFPLVGLALGLLAGLLVTRSPLRGFAVSAGGGFGLLLGALGALGWHYYPYRLHEPTPFLYTPGNGLTDRDRAQLVEMINRSGFGAQLSDWAPPWWPLIISYLLGGLVLGVLAGLLRRRLDHHA